MTGRSRWVLLGPLIALPVVALVVAAFVGALDGAGRVEVQIDGADGGVARVGVAAFRIDPLGDQLRAEVPSSHRLEVLGYAGEPALRQRTDGTTERNANATVGTASPDEPDPGRTDGASGPPSWVPLGGDELVWHDHRAHWFAGVPAADDGEQVGRWALPVWVDGQTHEVRGTFVWRRPRASTLLGVLLVAGLAATTLLRCPSRPAAVAASNMPAAARPRRLSRVVLGAAMVLATAGPVLGGGVVPTAQLITGAVLAGGLVLWNTVVDSGPSGRRVPDPFVVAVPTVIGSAWLLERWRWLVLPPTTSGAAAVALAILCGIAIGALAVVGSDALLPTPVTRESLRASR